MRKLIVFFFPLLFLIACGPNKQELAQKQAVIDSLKNENDKLQKESLEKTKRDSIAKAEAFEKATQDNLTALRPKGVNNEGKGGVLSPLAITMQAALFSISMPPGSTVWFVSLTTKAQVLIGVAMEPLLAALTPT